ncbi:MAG: hypothetical protein KKA81_10025 [Bacteroidetes bacterium]|nr:hypothetical protein [Bacteroidota bacterium]
MKRIIFMLILTALSLASCTLKQDNSAIRSAIQDEIRLHPETRLADIYKNFFQDAYGPGHMINDSAAAMRYLLYELSEAVEYDTVLIQPLGEHHNFYRVNLSLVRDSILPLDVLYYAFSQSAALASPPPVEEWKNYWENVSQTLEDMGIEFPGQETDRQLILENLRNNDPVGHHSEAYSQAYHPHYRIVHRNMMDTIRYYLPAR